MVETLRPENAAQLRDALRWAVAEEQPLAVAGTGSKAALGRPTNVTARLELAGLSGITNYEPEELVLTADAGTPIAEVRTALDEHDQILGFDPPDYSALLGGRGSGTLGGVIATNLSGPGRIKVGAARDHLLGFSGVSGRGETFKSGGRVVKNVTGYDLGKVMAGSFGTLAALEEVSVKVMPKPEKVRTVVLLGLDEAAALAALRDCANSTFEPSGLAHLPEDTAADSTVSYVAQAKTSVTAIRLEGPTASVLDRAAKLRTLHEERSASEELHGHNSSAFWSEVRDVLPFTRNALAGFQVWRLSVPPAAATEVAAKLRQGPKGACYFDWAGGLIWLAIEPRGDAAHESVRAAIRETGGHATLVRAAEDIRARVPVFQPEPPPLAALTMRLKEAFDPRRVLNPGRMYQGV